MGTQQALLDIIGDIYEATITPEYWTHALQKICQLIDARSAGIYLRDRRNNTIRSYCQYGMPEIARMMYSNGLGRLDPGIAMLESKQPGEPFHVINLQKPDGSPRAFYQLALRPVGIHHISCVCIFNDDELVGGLGLHRGHDANPFEDELLKQVSQLAPHIQRAIRIQREFATLRQKNTTLEAGYAKLGLGMLVVDEQARPTYMNPMAKKLLQTHPAISLAYGNRLKAHEHEQTVLLNDHIQQCMNGKPNYVPMGLRHPERQHPLVMMVVPLTEDIWQTGHDGRGAIIYMNDPAEEQHFHTTESLMESYDLSQAEARVALCLLSGMNTEQIAEELNRSVNTVKTQIKRVYEKTGVKRQADLVRLLVGASIPIN